MPFDRGGPLGVARVFDAFSSAANVIGRSYRDVDASIPLKQQQQKKPDRQKQESS